MALTFKGLFVVLVGVLMSSLVLKHLHSGFVYGSVTPPPPPPSKAKDDGDASKKCPLYSQPRVVVLDNSYYPKEHKEHLVRDYFDARPCEWEVVKYGRVNEFDLAWVFSAHQLRYDMLTQRKVLTNHIQNQQKIVEKDQMYRSLQAAEKAGVLTLPVAQIVPKTYVLRFDKPSDNEEREWDAFTRDVNANKLGVWISKPTNQFGGRGIEIVKNAPAFLERINNKRGRVQQNLVVQKYIENPLLLDARKFDIRCYLMILDSEEYVAFYHPGFVRRSLFEYKMDRNAQNDEQVHLTNVEAQKKHPEFEQLKDQTLMSIEQFEERLRNDFARTPEQINDLHAQIKVLSANILIAMRRSVSGARRQFQVLGCDFMIDDAWKVWLIEINKSPSWQILHDSQLFKVPMLHAYIDAVLQYQDRYDKLSAYEAVRHRFYNETLIASNAQNGTHFELLMDGWSDYVYGVKSKGNFVRGEEL